MITEQFIWDSIGVKGEHITLESWTLNSFDDELRNSIPKFIVPHYRGVQFIRVSPKAMLCVMTLANGFDVRGEAACIDPETFDSAIGAKWALADAVRKASTVIGYLEQQRKYEGKEYTTCKENN